MNTRQHEHISVGRQVTINRPFQQVTHSREDSHVHIRSWPELEAGLTNPASSWRGTPKGGIFWGGERVINNLQFSPGRIKIPQRIFSFSHL